MSGVLSMRAPNLRARFHAPCVSSFRISICPAAIDHAEIVCGAGERNFKSFGRFQIGSSDDHPDLLARQRLTDDLSILGQIGEAIEEYFQRRARRISVN